MSERRSPHPFWITREQNKKFRVICAKKGMKAHQLLDHFFDLYERYDPDPDDSRGLVV